MYDKCTLYCALMKPVTSINKIFKNFKKKAIVINQFSNYMFSFEYGMKIKFLLNLPLVYPLSL